MDRDTIRDIIYIISFVILGLTTLLFMLCATDEYRSNDEEIVRCVEKQNYNFKVKGGVITCLDRSK